MLYTTLYKLDSKGKTRVIEFHLDGDKRWTNTGILDGKIIEGAPTVAQPKNVGRANATTAEEQAELELKSDIQKKKDKGYKEDITKIEEGTDYFEPMLAHKLEDRLGKELSPTGDWEGWIMQPKFDGIRCVIRMEDGVPVARTRKGKEIHSIPHILAELTGMPDWLVLDGELYNHKLKDDFEKIVSLVRKVKLKPEHLIESKKFVRFYCYDWISTQYNVGVKYRNRRLSRIHWLRDLNSEFIDNVADIDAHCLDHVYQYLDLLEKDGYEGVILRNLEGIYHNRRSTNLLKVKSFIDEEFEIVGVEEGKGKRSEQVGALVMTTADGTHFNGSVKGKDEFRERIFAEQDKVIGKMATLRFFEYTRKSNVPRFPVVHAIRDYE